MHYIIGTTFMPTGSPTNNSGGLRSVSTVNSPNSKRGSTGPFKKGVQYTLYNIEMTDKGLKYVFYDQRRDITEVIFKSSKEADLAIANAIGDPLPDYDSFYKNML